MHLDLSDVPLDGYPYTGFAARFFAGLFLLRFCPLSGFFGSFTISLFYFPPVLLISIQLYNGSGVFGTFVKSSFILPYPSIFQIQCGLQMSLNIIITENTQRERF